MVNDNSTARKNLVGKNRLNKRKSDEMLYVKLFENKSIALGSDLNSHEFIFDYN